MARAKQPTPVRRELSSEYISKADRKSPTEKEEAAAVSGASGSVKPSSSSSLAVPMKKEAGVATLLIDVAGIYISFLTWAYLQEKLTTTNYGASPISKGERFKFPVFLLTIQSLFAALGGKLFTVLSTPKGQPVPAMIPSRAILPPLLLVAFTNALAAPFGYAALGHIDYITYILAKSCKLLPVMFLHITLFRKRYPLYKYLVVAAVTAGVAVFTLHSGSKKHKASSHSGQTSWGLLLLGINLLFDGLTNSTQDYIFQTFQPYTGPQMMMANNLLSSIITGAYLVLSPWLVKTGLGEWFGMAQATGQEGELAGALAFLARHPEAWRDVLGFALCGCIGQVFIFHTLSTFSSVLLVTVTVTRKMFTMILSVVAFGHRLSEMQWLGVGLVFGGIGVEAGIARREKLAKEEAKRKVKAALGKAQ
ncbi:UAA transporter [Neurospora crassa]|uniref:UDP-galactose transporter homolog 1 n=1 Tax=Neurospora crassa (strain ATCC 24698 / 74-OR23-1A / CBS 708.71 / DSM 1257 / FGSC 987) TaxID=367110 RepID=A7UWQ9_NEUCR|nr:solute carrier family 35 member B1 protein [Neurospora crassa OR74A]EDO65118.1 solute carrier family 35 member B1 protein [Neurospora crassa OR74A]KHE87088.1 UAA transporter [Neurospora crassa]|eukprot:XP_001728209.1 solute carrier family 35 member B1 protein [Neurospora crassa OR74A]